MTDEKSLKTVKLSSNMGGSGKQTASLVSGAGADFDKKLAAYKQRMKAHTDAIKRHLTQFIEKTTHPADRGSGHLRAKSDAKQVIDITRIIWGGLRYPIDFAYFFVFWDQVAALRAGEVRSDPRRALR
jgi:hypothetical protein